MPADVPNSTAKIVVGPGVIKGLLEHFGGMGGRQDPQLHWEFGSSDVKVKSVNTGSKGAPLFLSGSVIETTTLTRRSCWYQDGALVSEINIETAEFSEYTVPQTRISMMFQWREFDVRRPSYPRLISPPLTRRSPNELGHDSLS